MKQLAYAIVLTWVVVQGPILHASTAGSKEAFEKRKTASPAQVYDQLKDLYLQNKFSDEDKIKFSNFVHHTLILFAIKLLEDENANPLNNDENMSCLANSTDKILKACSALLENMDHKNFDTSRFYSILGETHEDTRHASTYYINVMFILEKMNGFIAQDISKSRTLKVK